MSRTYCGSTVLTLALLSLTISAAAQEPDGYARQLVDAKRAEPRSSLHGGLAQPWEDVLARAVTLDDGESRRAAVTIHVRSLQEVPRVVSLVSQPVNSLGTTVEAYVTQQELSTLAGDVSVVVVEPIEPALSRAVSQGRLVHNAQNWIGGGFLGTGVKVGIIDDFAGIRSLMGSELPGAITGRCYSSVGVSSANLAACDTVDDHGTAVAESLVDVAPGVQLFVANPISRIDFANTVTWMLSMGVSVINYSASWKWDGPGDGTSPYSDSPLKAVDAAVNGGAVFVTAAGNESRASWLGPWRDVDLDGAPEFGFTNSSEYNSVLLLAGETVTVQLRWQDSWFGASRDLDLGLGHSTLGLVKTSLLPQDGLIGDTPYESLTYTAPITGFYDIFVNHFHGPLPSWIQVQAFTSQQLSYYSAGSIGNPAESANPGLLAVGAAAWNSPTVIEDFSSQGPTPDGRVKPDIVGADRADTVTDGPSGFAGTSQASPHVAGLAALVKGAFPSYTPSQVASYLKSFAQPRGASPNNTWGAGFAYLADLCSFTLSATSVPVAAAGGPFQINVTTAPSCSWNAISNSPWLIVQAGAHGSGAGTVTVTAAANGPSVRVGTFTIAGVTVTVNQGAAVLGPPSSPLNFSGAVSDNIVSFTWQAPASGGTTGYVIEAGSAAGLANLAILPVGNTLSFATPAPNGTYFVRIRAQSAYGSSPPSAELIVTVGPLPPGPPQHLSQSVNAADVSLTWGPPSTGGSPVGYIVEASTSPGGPALVALNVAATGLFVPAVAPGVYYVRVRAVNSVSVSAPSNEVIVSVAGPTLPATPTAFNTLVFGSTVTLMWNAPSSGGLSTGYVIQAGSGPGLADLVNAPIGGTTSYTATSVPPGTYYVRVLATNGAGIGPPSVERVVVVGAAGDIRGQR